MIGRTDAEVTNIPTKEEIMDIVYPVGSIYISISNLNPNIIFGGKWIRLDDRFLIGAGNLYGKLSTGGEEAHVLTIDELPRHDHKYLTYADWTGRTDYSGNEADHFWGSTTRISGSTGGNQPHNNMPPYLSVYMWRRNE